MAEITSTPCHSKANSYLSYDEIDERLSIYDWWAALTPTRKKNAAILAASALDAVPYTGRKLLIGQRMAFPRYGHPTRTLNWPFLKQETNISGVGYHTDVATNSVSFYLPVFPSALEVGYVIGGNSYTATMSEDGSISGPSATGSCNRETAYVEISFSTPIDADSDVTYTASGYSRSILQSESLKFDTSVFGSDFLKYGAVRILSDLGDSLLDITSNDPWNGTVTLGSEISSLPNATSSAVVVHPITEDVKIAQLIQIVHIITNDAVFPPEGVRLIRIGDTMVSFTENASTYSKFVRIASRYGLHPAAFTRIAPYTIYGASITMVRG